MKILYLEDEKHWRMRIKEVLEERGHMVVAVATIEEALRDITHMRFDRIICDGTILPGEIDNGIEFAQQLISQRIQAKVVVFTADTRRIPSGVPYVEKNAPGTTAEKVRQLLAR